MMLAIEQPHSRQVRHHGQLIHIESPRPPDHNETEADHKPKAQAWRVPLHKSVASTGEGVETLVALLDKHRAWLQASGEWRVREQLRVAHTLENIVRAELMRRIAARLPRTGLDDLVEAVCQRTIDPYTAAHHLMAEW
jgi:LAO/AO transport system kinase